MPGSACRSSRRGSGGRRRWRRSSRSPRLRTAGRRGQAPANSWRVRKPSRSASASRKRPATYCFSAADSQVTSPSLSRSQVTTARANSRSTGVAEASGPVLPVVQAVTAAVASSSANPSAPASRTSPFDIAVVPRRAPVGNARSMKFRWEIRVGGDFHRWHTAFGALSAGSADKEERGSRLSRLGPFSVDIRCPLEHFAGHSDGP